MRTLVRLKQFILRCFCAYITLTLVIVLFVTVKLNLFFLIDDNRKYGTYCKTCDGRLPDNFENFVRAKY